MSIRIGRTIDLAVEAGAYSSHPCVTRDQHGDWLLLYARSGEPTRSGEPSGDLIHPPNDPRFVNILVRSSDEGKTWKARATVPDPTWSGVECSGVAVLSDGAILINQFKFGWHTVEDAKRLWALGLLRPFILDPGDGRWRMVRDPRDWDLHRLPWVRTDQGSYVHRSTDGGRTWDTACLAIDPYQGAFSPKGAVELDGGEVILALGSHEHDPLAASVIVRSLDAGRTWGRPEAAARGTGLIFSEPTIVAADTRRLLVFSREEATGLVYQSVSDDRGHTWALPQQLPLWGSPTHAIRLHDGRILIVYGYRRPPYGIRGCLSVDGGRTWGPEVVVRSGLRDSRAGLNLGYPSAIEYREGEVFVAYYAEDELGTVGIRGTYMSID